MSRYMRHLGFVLMVAGCGGGAKDSPDSASSDLPVSPDAGNPAEVGGNPAASEVGCEGWSTLKRLSPAEVAELIGNASPIVINVHYPYEGDIPGTDATIPYDDVKAIEDYLKYDRCADVLLVCKSGSMSENAGNALIKRGYLRIRDLKGGMIAWQAAGYPLLKDGGS
jgi:rhodanese-related sulfurtransferase